ncbi:uncharacterized protein BDZ99DRAFT_564758 [Mytilinidion resinicola]|uniref:Uncharacterized protein n=1 Tax=Mytilinidion resinicola TaxID=574789 RepID=A0A6A6Z9P7_9PEZI|nr:uncharacterized protein BDZ99DRAFT_564758 [Mytilinidion resinicola]KAF2816937.1 hypothetical protein BDZ99DRAFT_564758 [Mytilinidion resinicola]
MAEGIHVPTEISRGLEDRPTAIQEAPKEPHIAGQTSEKGELETREADRAGAESRRGEVSEVVVNGIDFQQFIIDNPREDERSSVPPHANEKTKNAPTYASFGDKTTTASTNAHGYLTQITRYLGVGQSGFVCVDLPGVPQPSDVHDRAEKLMALSTHNDEAIAAYFNEDIPVELGKAAEMLPTLEFIHNRWPLFTTQPTDHPYFTKAIQHIVFQDIVFQQYRYESTTEGSVTIPSTFFISADLLIRELDFIDQKNQFNKDTSQSSQYSQSLGANDRNLILTHENINESYKVALAIAVFVNGEAQPIEHYMGDWYQTKGEEDRGHQLRPLEPLLVTLAFKLVPLQAEIEENVPLISKSDLSNAYKAFTAPSFTKLTFSADPHLDFALRRNLEHILSVCSIPVGSIPLESEGSKVALTCGDISGHRIVTSATFFAFHFLLSMFEYLEKPEPQQGQSKDKQEHTLAQCKCRKDKRSACERAFLAALRNRIKDTCRAHLTWIEQTGIMRVTWKEGQTKDMRELLGADYWITGTKIPHMSSKEVLSPKSLSDWPLNIIKFADFAIRTKNEEIKGLFEERGNSLRSSVGDWVEALDLENARGFYAIPRPLSKSRPGQKRYRLEDHVWMWRALLSIKRLGLQKELKTSKTSPTKPPRIGPSGRPDLKNPLHHSYTPADFQSKAIRRFTTENNVSRRKMVAISRTASASRFLFHSTDTALFYDTWTPLFDKSDTLWIATNDVQRFHKGNEDLEWGNPLRYALAMMMAKNGHPINTRSPSSMFTIAKDILLGSSSRNGIFPGQLQPGSKEPDFSWKDFHWQASFEVPCILWECRLNVEDSKKPEEANPVNPTAGQPIQIDPQKESQTLEMRKSIPFNILIDEKSIVELSDEWLYDYPEFLDSNDDIEGSRKSIKLIIKPSDTLLRGVVVDVPRSDGAGHCQQLENGFNASCNLDIYDRFNRPRTAQDAKKRLIWLPNPNSDTKELCILASPKAEQECLEEFFEKHDYKRKYFFDEVIATSNLWKTEFHLSSYQVFEAREGRRKGDQAHEGKRKGDLNFLGGSMVMRRAGTGFRFVGDFWDRYWTCHVLEHEPTEDSQREQSFDPDKKDDLLKRFKELIRPEDTLSKFERDKEPWRQRKVLELLLFDLMLKKIAGRYGEMFEQTGERLSSLFPRAKTAGIDRTDVLLVLHTLLSIPMNTSAYSEFRKKWPAFQYTLQVMEEDLKENLEKIGFWRDRESERQLERPRWTRNDERKYRPVISKVTASNNQRIRILEHYLADIRSLRLSLERMSDSTRDELNYESAENVRFFTYVTVIFLPLGFATGIFSMNAAPGKKTLNGMVITAIITVIVTIIVLTLIRPVLTVTRPIRLKASAWLDSLRKAREDDAENSRNSSPIHNHQIIKVASNLQPTLDKEPALSRLLRRVKDVFSVRAARPMKPNHHPPDLERGQKTQEKHVDDNSLGNEKPLDPK